MASAPLFSSTISILVEKSCAEDRFCLVTTEYIAKGPALPIRPSWTVVEVSIFGLRVPGCGTVYAKVPFKVGGGSELRSCMSRSEMYTKE